LTYWPLTPFYDQVIYVTGHIPVLFFMSSFNNSWNILKNKYFCILISYATFDLWPHDPKMYQIIRTFEYMSCTKFEQNPSNDSWDIAQIRTLMFICTYRKTDIQPLHIYDSGNFVIETLSTDPIYMIKAWAMPEQTLTKHISWFNFV